MTDTLRRQLVLAASLILLAPRAAKGQRQERIRRIGLLSPWREDDPAAQSRLVVFKEALGTLGWAESRNLRIELRWASGDTDRASAVARELVALQPEVIVSATTPVTAALQRETATIPIVFAVVNDPVGSGFVETLSHPGSNITGFVNLQISLAEKWLELLKALAPRVTRVTAMFNPDTAPFGENYVRHMASVAPKLGVVVTQFPVRSDADIKISIAALGTKPNSGLIAVADSFMFVHRKVVIALAAEYKVPAMYGVTYAVPDGGLISYGVDFDDEFRRAAAYVDRILRGAKPAELPVQQPDKFELAINRKTAHALGLTIPPTLLLRATRVIE